MFKQGLRGFKVVLRLFHVLAWHNILIILPRWCSLNVRAKGILDVGEVSGSVLTGKCEVIPPATRKFRTGQPVTVHRFMGKPD